MQNHILFGLGGLLLGAALGSVVTWRVVKERYDSYAKAEIEEVRQFYKNKLNNERQKKAKKVEVEEDTPKPVKNSKDKIVYEKMAANYGDIEQTDPLPQRNTVEEAMAIFNVSEDDPRIIERRTSMVYIISADEFSEEMPHYDKTTITYWDGDKTLADEQELPIPGVRETVGYHALDNFGWFSNDPNVVYVRNERFSLDLEVVRNPGRYEVEVAGFAEDHTWEKPREKKRPRKMRVDD